MQRTLPGHISSRQLAECLAISERAVHIRAKKDRWPMVYKRVQGGSTHLYMVSGLPQDIRKTIAKRIEPRFAGAAAQAGYARAKELESETQASDMARKLAKETGLAAYLRLSESRQTEAKARREILRARDAFLTATGLSKKKGTALFIREYTAGAIALPAWIETAVGTRKGKVSLSWASLYRWEKAYTESGLAGLAGQYEATRSTGIPEPYAGFCQRPCLPTDPILAFPRCARRSRPALPARPFPASRH